MGKYVEDSKDEDAHEKVVRTRRIIIVAAVVFTVVPVIVTLLSGSLRF